MHIFTDTIYCHVIVNTQTSIIITLKCPKYQMTLADIELLDGQN